MQQEFTHISENGNIPSAGLLNDSMKKTNYLLFILPFVFGLLAYIYYYQSKAFFTTYPDSTYIYLINGANIASGNFNIGHYDNPGTTAHWMAAVVIYITHLFLGKGPLLEDVLSNPEFYLHACAITCIALLMLSVYAAAKLILKKTGNLTIALFFQLIPVCSYLNVHHIVRICPEYLMIMMLPYYSAYLWVLCYAKNNSPDHIISIKSILFMAFVTAALIIAKITCAPLLFVPLFFINRISKIIIYLVATAAFAMLILFPVWPNLNGMFEWFFGLATHTGIYGSGQEQIIDSKEYIVSLKKLFITEWFFTAGYIIASFMVVAGVVKKKWNDNFFKLTLALWLTISLQLLLAAKHYKFHYIIPAQSLIIPTVLGGWVSLISFKRGKIPGAVALAACSIFLVYKLAVSSADYWNGNKEYESSLSAQKYADLPKIITTTYEQSCFPESALHFGTAYGGHFFEAGYSFLRTLYPKSFVYDMRTNKIDLFFLDTPYADLFEKYPKILVYFLQKDEYTEKTVLTNLTAEYGFGIKSIDLAEANPYTGEKFYIINVDTSSTQSHYTEKKSVVCDFEKVSPDNSYFISSDGSLYFGSGDLHSTEKCLSAVTSLKSTPKNQYICWANLPVKAGDGLEITVNCYAEDTPGGITIASPGGKGFEKTSQSVINDYGNGWKKLILKAKIPADYQGKEIGFSLFYFGSKACYFDDLNIVFLKK
jgi:hypothetical protein